MTNHSNTSPQDDIVPSYKDGNVGWLAPAKWKRATWEEPMRNHEVVTIEQVATSALAREGVITRHLTQTFLRQTPRLEQVGFSRLVLAPFLTIK